MSTTATTIICAWCGLYLGSRSGPAAVSHGICERCMEEQLRQIEDEAGEQPASDLAPHPCRAGRVKKL